VSLVRDEHDLATAQGVLDASGITVPRGRLEEGVWDEQGHLYRLEPWVVSDPLDLVEEDEEADIDSKDVGRAAVEVPKKSEATVPDSSAVPLKIKCRLSDRGTDLVVAIGRNEKVRVLAAAIMKEAQVSKNQLRTCASLTRSGSLPRLVQ